MIHTTLTLIVQLVRWLISSPVGLLIIAALSYWAVGAFALVEPYSGNELLLWFDSLSEASKTALAASILTVVGFLIAFQTGYSGMKKERLISKEMAVADAIQLHYSKVVDCIYTLSSLARAVVKTKKQLRKDPDGSHGSLAYLQRRIGKISETADELTELVLKCNALASTHGFIVDRHVQLPGELGRLAERARKVQQHARFAASPDLFIDVDPKSDLFWDLCNAKRAKRFLRSLEKHQVKIMVESMGIVESLYSEIAPDNFATWLNSADWWIKIKQAAAEKEIKKLEKQNDAPD